MRHREGFCCLFNPSVNSIDHIMVRRWQPGGETDSTGQSEFLCSAFFWFFSEGGKGEKKGMNCEILYISLENANSAAEPKVNAVNQTSTITSPLLPTVVTWFASLQVQACARALCLTVWALTNFYYSFSFPTESYSREPSQWRCRWSVRWR